nr:twin-arginine translocation signal domain-containing protein [Microthrixaceae bacterium]
MTALIEVPPTNPTRRAGITRRTFLAGTGAAAGAAAAAVALGPQLAFASPTSPSDGDVIVLIFLRGGADGLSLVAPWQMPTYRTLRP